MHTFRNHVLVFVYSGELEISEKDNSVTLQKGECAFIGKDTPTYMTENPSGSDTFHSLFMALPRDFLCEFYHTIDNNHFSNNCKKLTLTKLPKRPEVTSLFESFKPFYRNSADLSDELTRIKIAEGLYALLKISDHYHFTLFDFTHKLNIIDILIKSRMQVLDWKEKQSISLVNYN